MSEFNPMPDQLQQDSGSPAVDVMAPPDQQQPAQAPPAAPAMPPSPDQGGPVPQGAAPQDNPNTHGWRAVLKGALSGLENHLKGAGQGLITGGIPGALVGAVAPGMAQNAMDYRRQELQNQQQQQQAQIKFTNAEAANSVVEAKFRDAQLEQMPKELQLKSSQLNETTVKTLAGAGVYPEVVVPNTDDGPKAAAAQLMDKYGAVPALTYIHVGDALLGYDPQAMSGNSAVIQQVNMLQKVTGGPQYTPGSLKMAPGKTKIMDDAMYLFNPPPQGSDKLPTQISQYDGFIRKVSLWSDNDPDKASTLAKLKDVKKNLQDALDAGNAEKEKLAKTRGAASQNAKTDTYDVNGELKTLTSLQAQNTPGAVKAAPASQARAKNSQFKDIYSGVDQMESAIGAMEQESQTNGKPLSLDAKTIANLTLALRSPNDKIVHNAVSALATQNLSQAQRQFVTAVKQLNERILSTRTIAGMGSQGSDTMRAAVADTLPGVRSGDTAMMRQQLGAVRNYLDNLKPGIQRTHDMVQPAAPAGKSAPAPGEQQQFTHLSASGKFGWDGSKWVPVK